jgi:hypothetical protein
MRVENDEDGQISAFCRSKYLNELYTDLFKPQVRLYKILIPKIPRLNKDMKSGKINFFVFVFYKDPALLQVITSRFSENETWKS